MTSRLSWAALGAAAVTSTLGLSPAFADDRGMEARFGISAHNIEITDSKNANKEDGPNVMLEASFDSPSWLAWAGAPRPYLTASVNTTGATSFAGVGLEWRAPLGAEWSIDPGVGYVIHDGAVNNPFPNGDPRATVFERGNVLLGSRDLFRTSLALSYRPAGPWGYQVVLEHYSHGQILGNGRNQGMDNLGVRLAYRFGER